MVSLAVIERSIALSEPQAARLHAVRRITELIIQHGAAGASLMKRAIRDLLSLIAGLRIPRAIITIMRTTHWIAGWFIKHRVSACAAIV